MNPTPGPTILSGALALRLQQLYASSPQPATALPGRTLPAEVVDHPPATGPGVLDAAFVDVDTLQHLHLPSGGPAALVCPASGRRAVARLFADAGQGGRIGLAPLLAYNLGLMYQLQPFLADPQHLPINSVDVAALVEEQAGPQQGTAGGHGALGAGSCARAVRICKLPRPSASPLGAAASAARGEDGGEDTTGEAGEAAAAAAGGGGDDAEAERQLLAGLSAYFTEAAR
jgi:hypothetical protein